MVPAQSRGNGAVIRWRIFVLDFFRLITYKELRHDGLRGHRIF